MDLNTRLVKLMQYYDYSPSIFADEVGIIRSSISHIVSGRNKPGVDLLQKVLKRFPEISTDWLLLGVGAMFKDVNRTVKNNDSIGLQYENTLDSSTNSYEAQNKKPVASVQMNLLDYVGDPDPKPLDVNKDDIQDEINNILPDANIGQVRNSESKELKPGIKRITVYYTDGTFGDFIQE